jgi:pyruvate-ferredoxin/flavodoxin oxidoreductase
MAKNYFTVDGNYAVSHVAYMYSDVAAIYPITPSSTMAENCDEMAAKGRKNLFDQKLNIVEMQSEGGAAGAVHGSLQAGALTTTFTASQGLLLMIPNMYKIAGELLPCVFHVSARSLACSALSIFGDHSDVMAARSTGFAFLASSSVEQAQDMAAIAHIATLESRIPFVHFFEGFRVSHEIQKIEKLSEEDMKNFLVPSLGKIKEFRQDAMNPNKPDTRGTAQNPDIYFQAREGVNKYYDDCPDKVQEVMDRYAKITGRTYKLFDYVGAKDAERIIIVMGSGAETVSETIKKLNKNGEKVGAVIVRLYRPFSAKHFFDVLPKTVKKIAVLDRTKEPGALGEPLYEDIQTVIDQARKGIIDFNFNVDPIVVGGRYGLSSKEFTPDQVVSTLENLKLDKPKHSFTVGITDDLTNLSLPISEKINVLPEGNVSCMFWGLGSDGTVGANKNSIKIIGDNTDNYAQGYFVYDSKKSGGITISHLRFGKEAIKAPYLINNADFIAVHNQAYLDRFNVLSGIKEGGIFLINSLWDEDKVWENLPYKLQKTIIDKKVKLYNINAYKVAESVGLGNRVNVIMQAAFFIISGIIKEDEAIKLIKDAIEKTYGRKGRDVVEKNWKAVDASKKALQKISYPDKPTAENKETKLLAEGVGGFVSDVASVIMRNEGDSLSVSKIPCDGKFPAGVTQYEKRGIATAVPVWIPENCIQCNICSFVCPHSVIRAKQIENDNLKGKPENFSTLKSTSKNDKDLQFSIQASPLDCTGCGSCIVSCPAKTKALELKPLEDVLDEEKEKYEFFNKLPNNVTDGIECTTLKGSQFLQPLFEFSGACAGCGETPYVKLMSQLVGNRLYVANATGCSSIYGGTAPFTPYCKDSKGRGPAWANSLFEDNAEFGFGMELAVSQLRDKLYMHIDAALNDSNVSADFKAALTNLKQLKNDSFNSVKAADRVSDLLENELKNAKGSAKEIVSNIYELKDYLGKKSFWIVGGDGWAYDIGYGGLDHVIAQGRDVNVLVMDTEVYSNTGGQSSKATPIGATAKFAAAGKRISKKDLGLMAMTYGYVYVASVSMGANRNQTIKAFVEAEKYPGPSLIIAYSPCINHGINMTNAQNHQKYAVESGYWPLYRYNPVLGHEGKNPLIWESPQPKIDYIKDFVEKERRFTALKNVVSKEEADRVFEEASKEVKRKREYYERLSKSF